MNGCDIRKIFLSAFQAFDMYHAYVTLLLITIVCVKIFSYGPDYAPGVDLMLLWNLSVHEICFGFTLMPPWIMFRLTIFLQLHSCCIQYALLKQYICVISSHVFVRMLSLL